MSKKTLTLDQKRDLILIARQTLTRHFDLPFSPTWSENFDSLKTLGKHGVFVTLKKQGHLRGCIGCLESDQPLIDMIERYTIQAALHDHRFPALTKNEVSDCLLELSVLSQKNQVSSVHDIDISKHGVILEKHRHSAVFLPKVATEQGWTKEQTLSQLALKAGLHAEDWKEDCNFWIFTAEEWRESDLI